MKSNSKGMTSIVAAIVVIAGTFLGGCGGGGSSANRAPIPSILNINSSTQPSSPVGLPVEINGSGFLSAPGKVLFTQGSIVATVVPSAGGWSDTGLVATVPTGDGTTSFTVPGSVTVTVVTSGGTSNGVALSLVQSLTFSPSNFVWTTTTALPTALTGLRAVAVPVDSTSARVIVTGGFNGTGNTTTVLSNTLAPAGTLGAWTSVGNTPLPVFRAHHGMVEADPGNSLVSANSRFVYVIGGQQNSSDGPTGTTTVYMASVDPNAGTVGTWTQLSSSLPEPLVGPAVALFNGYIYVVGGLRPDSTPTPNVYSAQVNSDGTLGPWSTSPNPYSPAVSFAPAFGFGGKLYVLGGDGGNSTNPNDQGSSSSGVNNVNFASASKGAVGTWTSTAGLNKGRKKHISWTAFGQVIAGEGVYNGSPGSSELEHGTINPADGTLLSWGGLTGSQAPSANVYNAAAFVSPLQSPAATPRFLLLGGQAFASVPPGPLSAKVFFNSAP